MVPAQSHPAIRLRQDQQQPCIPIFKIYYFSCVHVILSFPFWDSKKKKKKEEEESVDKEKGMFEKKRKSTVFREKPGSRRYILYLLQRK